MMPGKFCAALPSALPLIGSHGLAAVNSRASNHAEAIYLAGLRLRPTRRVAIVALVAGDELPAVRQSARFCLLQAF
jgi:hypothetical protein